ncbi:ABC-type transporter Mla maintaining outer membrane lipid asymmetry, MlaB component, contains STAS domain [Streptomyces sp. TLI_105]|nr:ABC-type transporter Mla maintaining outer membrane lipid asymmetry, MlaB component, contains STAS domain [Streptomyces sp. TLI_105]
MSYGRPAGLPVVDTSRALELRLSGPPTPDDVGRLCALLDAAEPTAVVCEIGGLAPAGLAAVDALARLKLTARRRGHHLRFEGAGPELRALLRLTGLSETLGL